MSKRDHSHSKHAEIGEYLSTFKITITSNSPSLYGNGLQQVEVTLSVEPVEGVQITPERYESLKIVYLKDNGEYEELPELHTEAFKWFASLTRDERFDYYSPATTLKRAVRPSPVEPAAKPATVTEISKKFYVSTVASGGTLIELHARIEMSPTAIFVTENTNDSTIELNALALPNYFYPEDYNWDNTWSQGNPPQSAFIQEWSLSAKQPTFSCAESRAENAEGMIKWERNAADITQASNVGVAYPGEKNVRYNPLINVGDAFLSDRHKTVQSSNNRTVVVVLQADNLIPYYQDGLAHAGPCRVLAYDMNGNTHELEFSFGNQGSAYQQRTTLRVNVNSPAKRINPPAQSSDGAPKK